MKIILGILRTNKKLNEIPKDKYQERIKAIEDEIFISVYQKIENALLTEDKMLVGLKFTQLRLGPKGDIHFKLMMESPTILEPSWRGILDDYLNKRQIIELESLAKAPLYSRLKDSLTRNESLWIKFITDREFMSIPSDWFDDKDETSQLLVKIVLANILKPSRSFDLYRELINLVMTP